ncbi:hypothetical protein BCV71DRAFT_240134 [Rhizopus microsporus]|uniref:Uncharacterized protein n=1 Tax=Rhizopus microsporus TaxID=58291 RepID=A0A1X0RK64_RHIZD|nr:hypothetical protein BCV71DRAFT_240134 [Rhizopus microsporus]
MEGLHRVVFWHAVYGSSHLGFESEIQKVAIDLARDFYLCLRNISTTIKPTAIHSERLSPRLILEQDDYEDYRENWQQLTCRGTLLSYFNIMLLAISEKSHGLSLNNHEKYQLNFIKC